MPVQILQLQQVAVEPLVYIGHQFVLDPLSNLVYLPTVKAQGRAGADPPGQRQAWSSNKSVELERYEHSHMIFSPFAWLLYHSMLYSLLLTTRVPSLSVS